MDSLIAFRDRRFDSKQSRAFRRPVS
jgi:hypothetical protein